MYLTGDWGIDSQQRSLKRKDYFHNYYKQKKMGIFQYSKTTGFIGEQIALNYLPSAILVRKSKYDIEWNNKKIEVKTAILNTENSWKFFFNNKKQFNLGNLYLFILLNKDKKLLDLFLISYQIIKENFCGKKFFEIVITKNRLEFYNKFSLKGGEGNGSAILSS